MKFEELGDHIRAHQAEYCELAENIWEKPEVAYQEKFACDAQVELLKKQGFEVTAPYAGVDTAYRASFGEGHPAFCIAAEYDALPDLGHGCGHNLIAAAAVAAGSAVKSLLEKYRLPGKIVVLGTPAEESGGGKVKMLEQHCLDDIDAVMMVHPSWRSTPDMGSTAIRRFDVEFFGKSAHAASSPELGLNALDGTILLFTGVNAWRQQLPETARLHGVVKAGGVMPNIIPDYSLCRFYLRSTSDEVLDRIEERFRDMVKGAALMTGTRAEIKPYSTPYRARKPNPELNRLYLKFAEAAGLNPVTPIRPGRGSSDFGDFSHKRPGAHCYFGIAHEEIPGHSVAFREAAGSEYGQTQMIKGAVALAQVGFAYLTDAEIREKVAQK